MHLVASRRCTWWRMITRGAGGGGNITSLKKQTLDIVLDISTFAFSEG